MLSLRLKTLFVRFNTPEVMLLIKIDYKSFRLFGMKKIFITILMKDRLDPEETPVNPKVLDEFCTYNNPLINVLLI